MESPKSYLNSLKSLVFRQILRKLSEFRWNNVYLAFFVKFLHLDIQETKVINLILSLEECTVTTDFKDLSFLQWISPIWTPDGTLIGSISMMRSRIHVNFFKPHLFRLGKTLVTTVLRKIFSGKPQLVRKKS